MFGQRAGRGRGGGGGTPLYKPYRYVPTHFGLELGMVFAGTTRVYERIHGFNSK